MTIAFLIVLALAAGMAVALYFQLKSSRRQTEAQNQLLTDYQLRVNEQQKLLDDYRALEKNFDNVGEGYAQALLAFDKIEEETQKLKTANEALEQRSTALQEQNNRLMESHRRATEVLDKAVGDLHRIAKETGNNQLMAVAGMITDIDDVEGQQGLNRLDNILMSQVATDAIAASGIEQANYLQFTADVAPDAAATMLLTNHAKAVRALTHLLDNARKFTTEGSVTLRATVDMVKLQATYAVIDTGEGIAADDAERIFEPYVKLNQFFDGQGVGLTVARNIARRLGGDVTYAPASDGKGSCFALTLPI